MARYKEFPVKAMFQKQFHLSNSGKHNCLRIPNNRERYVSLYSSVYQCNESNKAVKVISGNKVQRAVKLIRSLSDNN